jgi:hypothetical protein
MELAKYSNKEIADVAFRCFLQRGLPGRSLKKLRAYVAGEVALLPAPADCSKQCLNCIINNNIKCTPPIDHAVLHQVCAPATRIMPPALSNESNPDKVSRVGMSTANMESKRKHNNCMYYIKEMRTLFSSPAVTTTMKMTKMITTPTTTATTMPTVVMMTTATVKTTTMAAVMTAPWSLT